MWRGERQVGGAWRERGVVCMGLWVCARPAGLLLDEEGADAAAD